MSKPNRTEAQRLLGALGIKIEELQSEINQMEAKRACPFWHDLFDEDGDDDCPYMTVKHLCECLEVCPSNEDAWCYIQVEKGVKEKKESEVIKDLKTICEKYADLRCDNCDIAET